MNLRHACYNFLYHFFVVEVLSVAICYKKLWKLLIDRDMQKKDLRLAAGLSTNVIAKLGKNQNVSTEVLGKICKTLDCEITDIMEFVDEEPMQINDNT